MNKEQLGKWLWRGIIFFAFGLLLYDLIHMDPLTTHDDVAYMKPLIYIAAYIVFLIMNAFVIVILYIGGKADDTVEDGWEGVDNFMGGYDIILSIFGFFQRVFPSLSIGLVGAVLVSLGSLIIVLIKYFKTRNKWG